VRRRPYVAVPDDAAFACAPFTFGPFARLADNAQHFLDTRGRCVASDRYFETPVAFPVAPIGVAVELARYYFTGLPGEDHYAAQLIVQTDVPWPDSFPPVRFRWQLRTEDSVGGCATADSDWVEQTIVPPPLPARYARRDGQLLQLGWPASTYSGTTEVRTPWRVHAVDPAAALPRSGRVLAIWGQVLSLGLFDALYLRGVSAYGLRGVA
jgi:hypothetical protein